MRFSELLQVTAAPLLVRPDVAQAIVGSAEFLKELEAAGWLKPVVRRNRLTLYSVRQLQRCAERLEAGETPSSMSGSTGSK